MDGEIRDSDELREFGERLSKFMERRGVTGRDLTRHLGLKSASSVTAIVKGRAQMSYCQLLAMLEIGMTLSEMFGTDRVRRSSEIENLADQLAAKMGRIRKF